MNRLPKLAPSIVRRSRIEAWLDHHAQTPLRFVAAPAGSGKTTAVVAYLKAHERPAYYWSVPPGSGVADLRRLLAAAAGADGAEGDDDVVRALESVPPCDIVIDDLDAADAATGAELAALVSDVPSHIAFIAIARSRMTIVADRLFARGLAALCDAEKLAFTASEAAALAESLGVRFSPADVSLLLEATDGWAIVVAGVLREAASTGTELAGAFERWQRAHARLFRGFLEGELDGVEPEERDAVRSMMAGSAVSDTMLQRLEPRGLFVRSADGRCQPYRALSTTRVVEAGTSVAATSAPTPPMAIRLFGRFEARIGDRSVAWVRRRDQHIVQFLALRDGGRATRPELQQAFWPNVDRSAAAQNLRTACSTIRRALAAIVGHGAVDRYFTVKHAVALNLDMVLIDVARFEDHLRDAEAEFVAGRHGRAIEHYTAAERLYAPLLCGEPADPRIAARARDLEEAFAVSLERLAEAWLNEGDYEIAGRYARRARALRPEGDAGRGLLRPLERTASGVLTYEDDVASVPV